MIRRSAFTLIEVLISVALLSIVMLGLYSALGMQRNSNKHLYGFLQKALYSDKTVMVLYKDILYSDGNITIKNGEFDRLCLNNTNNSLYELSRVKVCWVVAKEEKMLLRIEGNNYRLPLRLESKVAVDKVMKNVILFDIVRKKDQILVILQAANEEPYTFMLQGIEPPPKKRKRKTPKNDTKKPPGGSTLPDGKTDSNLSDSNGSRGKPPIPPI